MASFNWILPMASLMLCLLLGFYVFFNNCKSFLYIIFLFFCLSVAGWIFSVFFLINFSQNIIWGILPFFFAGFMVCFLLIFVLKIGNIKNENIYFYLLILLPMVLLSYLLFAGKIIEAVVLAKDNFVVTSFSEYYISFVVYALVYIFFIFFCLIYKYIKKNGIEKMRIKYILLGILAFIIPTMFTNMILPTFFDIWIFNGIGPIFSVFMVISISYAIVRYRLMDIYFVFRLGTIFTFLLFGVIFIYILLNYLLFDLLKIAYPANIIISSFVVTISFLPLRRFVELVTDKIFFRRYYKFDDVLGKIRKEIRISGLNLDKNLNAINTIVSSVLKVDRSIIAILIPKDHFISKQIIGVDQEKIEIKYNNSIINYLLDSSDSVLDREKIEKCEGLSDEKIDLKTRRNILKEMDRLKISLVVPINLKNKLIGVYLLGNKKSGNAFNSRDMKLLKHIAWELGYVIDNARSFEELKRLDESKSKFISVVSHQLRTPATISRYNLELALDKNMNTDDKNRAIADAYDGVLLFSRQLDQLLTVLEVEDKDIRINKKLVDLNVFFADFVKRNKLLLKSKKLKLETNFNFSKNKISFDAGKINKVLDIIFLNSVNYSNLKGKISISTWVKKFNKKNSLVFSFSDNGIGIKEDDKPNIFKKFYRGLGADIMSPSGFGLGLFIAKKIVESHGGNIWFENSDEKGTVFYFTLPI